jgi:hypothetical protein
VDEIGALTTQIPREFRTRIGSAKPADSASSTVTVGPSTTRRRRKRGWRSPTRPPLEDELASLMNQDDDDFEIDWYEYRSRREPQTKLIARSMRVAP